VNKSEVTYTLEEITPEIAKRYLECNKLNYRRLNLKLVAKYANEMTNGNWRQDHPQGVAFDRDGNLGDGQHRLKAIVASGVTVRMWVLRGCDPEALYDIDRGHIRTEADLLRARGFREDVDTGRAIAVARYMLTGLKGGSPNQCVRAFAKANETLIGTFLLEFGNARPRRSEVVAAFCNATREFPDGKVLDCARRYAKSEHGDFDDPLYMLRVKLIEGNKSRRFMGTGLIYALTVTALRAALDGRKLQHLRAATRDFAEPVVRAAKNGARSQPSPMNGAAAVASVAAS
jgi:hypothetical protein